MAGNNKSKGQSERNLRVLFQVLNTGGVPSIQFVNPLRGAADVSVVDTAVGRFTVTIKNFKGQNGQYNIQLTCRTISIIAAAVTDSYTGDDLTFEITMRNDAGAATDSTVDAAVEAF